MKKVIVKPVGPTDVIKTCPEASGRDSEPSSTGLQTSALLSSAQRDSGMDVGGGQEEKHTSTTPPPAGQLTRPPPSAIWAPPRRRSPGLRTDKL